MDNTEGLGQAMGESAIREITHPRHYFWGNASVICPGCGYTMLPTDPDFKNGQFTVKCEMDGTHNWVERCSRVGVRYRVQLPKFVARIL